jgi:hypothetical protein
MAFVSPKKLSPQQITGQRGELLATERALSMNLIFQPLGRLETGVDGMMEIQDPATGATTGKWIAAQVKTTEKRHYTAETEAGFEYLLEPGDLENWRGSNVPVIIILVRLADSTMYWKPVDASEPTQPRRLRFDKAADVFDRGAADRIVALTIERGRLGSFVPPMLTGDPVHLNLLGMVLPTNIFVGRSLFRSQREAVKEMMLHRGRHYFDWVIRERTFWSFRDPRGSAMAEIVDIDSLECLETEAIALPDDPDDENAFIDLLRRSVEAQVRDDLAFDKESRSLFFRAQAPGTKRSYEYRSLSQMTSADVVSVYQKEGREMVMRHHAFSPRYMRLGDDWFISVTSSFVFTSNGYQPHRASSVLLAGKKRFERNGSLRGQFLMWRHFLIASGKPSVDLLTDPAALDPRPRIHFEPLEPTTMERAVPEDAWRREDPTAKEHASAELLL